MSEHSFEDAYFAASNSANGFFCYYDDCFDRPEISYRYLIKGGPGTGKSRFMRDVASAGEKRDYAVEYIYCSSDPTSLDGIILKKGTAAVALLDATAPHTKDTKNPGIEDEIVDLGQFWDGGKLKSAAREIAVWNEKKRAAYASAYRYLSGAGEMNREILSRVENYMRTDEIRAFAGRLSSKIPLGKGFSSRPALQNAFGMNGKVSLDSFFSMVNRRYLIEDFKGSASLLLGEIGKAAMERRQPIRVSHDPILPDRLDGICFPEAGVAFVVGSARNACPGASKIRMRRFLDKKGLSTEKPKVLYAEQMLRAMMGGAREALEDAKVAHFELERQYCSAMDFHAKEVFTEAFIEKFFSEKD